MELRSVYIVRLLPSPVARHGKRDTLYRIEREEEGNIAVADMSCDGILLLELPEDSSSEEDVCPIPYVSQVT